MSERVIGSCIEIQEQKIAEERRWEKCREREGNTRREEGEEERKTREVDEAWKNSG